MYNYCVPDMWKKKDVCMMHSLLWYLLVKLGSFDLLPFALHTFSVLVE